MGSYGRWMSRPREQSRRGARRRCRCLRCRRRAETRDRTPPGRTGTHHAGAGVRCLAGVGRRSRARTGGLAVSFVLARSQPVIHSFQLAELATSFLNEIRLPMSLGDQPNPVRRR